MPNIIMRKENELLTIKAKSTVELKVSGNLYDIICGSNEISLKIKYNSNNLPEWITKEFNENQRQITESLYKKLTKIKIESIETKIELK